MSPGPTMSPRGSDRSPATPADPADGEPRHASFIRRFTNPLELRVAPSPRTGELVRAGDLLTLDTPDSHTKIDRVLGSDCIEFNNPMGASWIYVSVPTSLDLAGSELTLTVELNVPRPAEVMIEYDSSDESVMIVDDRPGAFKRTEPVEIADPGVWSEVTFTISDPLFERRVNGADFRIVVPAAPATSVWVRSVVLESSALTDADPDGGPGGDDTQVVISTSETPRVSIVMPVFNHSEFTLQCLRHVELHPPATPYELIIVDDGSDDEHLVALERIVGASILRLVSNVGFAAACNRGAALAKADLLLFLNNDTVPTANWLDALVAAWQPDRSIRIVGSKLLYPELDQIQHAGVSFNDRSGPFYLGEFLGADDDLVVHSRRVPAVTGASLLTDAGLFEQLQGFDESYRNGYEDIDFCLRANEAGVDSFYAAESVLYHYQSITDGRYDHESANRDLFLERWSDYVAERLLSG